MKKTMYILMILCFLLSGCSALKTNDVYVDSIDVGTYDQNNVILTRETTRSNMSIEMIVENYKEDPEFTFTLYKNGEAVEAKEGVLFSDISMELIRGEDVIEVKEHVYYYDAEDKDANFAYDQVSYILLQPSKNDASIVHPKLKYTKNFRYEVFDVFKAFTYSLQTGIYSSYTVFALYTYALILVSVILLAVLFITMKKYSITKERPKHIAIYNYALIGNFILILFINYSDYATLNVSFTARSIDAVLKTILVIGLIVRLGIAISVKKAWNKEKGLS